MDPKRRLTFELQLIFVGEEVYDERRRPGPRAKKHQYQRKTVVIDAVTLTHFEFRTRMASSTSSTAIIGRKGPKISLRHISDNDTKHVMSMGISSTPVQLAIWHSLIHQNVIHRHVGQDRRRDALVLVYLSAKYHLPLRPLEDIHQPRVVRLIDDLA